MANQNAKSPSFPRVAMTSDHDDVFACVASLMGKTIEEVKERAVQKCKIPMHGPYWLDEKGIQRIFAAFGIAAGAYVEVTTPLSGIPPETALLMVDYDPETEIGRHVLMQRVRNAKEPHTHYIIDPGYWVEPEKQIETDPKDLMPAYYIGLHDTAKLVSNGKK
ncbi:MAG: hypothetical protein HZC22_07820 [Rhodocyclales bacterium]|nr:hypothetical protein [Rhodocyclales bacterium]